MNNDMLNDLITGIGAIGEIAGLLRDNLIKNGFTRKEACEIVQGFIRETFKKDKEG